MNHYFIRKEFKKYRKCSWNYLQRKI